jgi:hypothetical protein
VAGLRGPFRRDHDAEPLASGHTGKRSAQEPWFLSSVSSSASSLALAHSRENNVVEVHTCTSILISDECKIAFEVFRGRQIPPFAAVYTREPSGVRQRSVGGDPLRKECSDRVKR